MVNLLKGSKRREKEAVIPKGCDRGEGYRCKEGPSINSKVEASLMETAVSVPLECWLLTLG